VSKVGDTTHILLRRGKGGDPIEQLQHEPEPDEHQGWERGDGEENEGENSVPLERGKQAKNCCREF
jgi:hypothetical protein